MNQKPLLKDSLFSWSQKKKHESEGMNISVRRKLVVFDGLTFTVERKHICALTKY